LKVPACNVLCVLASGKTEIGGERITHFMYGVFGPNHSALPKRVG
jgi:hypothetical protein